MKSAPLRHRCKLSLFAVSVLLLVSRVSCQHDYVDALNKALMFLEAQRQGVLPSNQRITWRGNSALSDGSSVGRDLSGGYADSGDNVKFGFPMAFTVSTLAWGVVEFSSQFNAAGQLGYALQAIKWGTDFFINAHPSPLTFYAQVGEGQADHSCWERPEDMDTPRNVYVIDQNHPGTEVAAETAAAMAAAAMAFAPSNPGYSATLVTHAKQLFTLADTYRGKYTDSIPDAQAYYASYSGYQDELLWAAAWLYQATREAQYLQYCVNNGASLGGSVNSLIQFDWDNKYVGAQMLMAKVLFSGEANAYSGVLGQYQKMAEIYVCAAMQLDSQNSNMQMPRTPGGMVYIQPWSSLQYVTTTALLVSIYSDYLQQAGRSLTCAATKVSPDQLNRFVLSQTNYILGSNPKGMSYMVGYGAYFPTHAHHRASSVVSKRVQPNSPGCNQGYSLFFVPQAPNVNLLTGAIVGGPDEKDAYTDSRQNYQQNEPSTYINAPLVGALARIVGGYVGGSGTIRVPITVAPPPPAAVKSTNPQHHKKRCGMKCHLRRKKQKRGKRPRPSGGPRKFQRALRLTNRAVSSWTSNGIAYSQYSVAVTNRAKKAHGSIVLSMGNSHNPQIWSVVVGSGNTRITLPASVTLQRSQSFTFGYIQAGGPLSLKVVSRT